VTNAFLRSLANLDLATSVVGRFRSKLPERLGGTDGAEPDALSRPGARDLA
jgi:hypothetical protein